MCICCVSPVNIGTSNGKQTTVIVDGQQYQAPGMVYFKKDGADKMIVTKADSGCAAQTLAPRKIEYAFWGNAIVGGFFGSTTDATTNKMWGYEDSVTINCQ
jgi:hypothetical protein